MGSGLQKKSLGVCHSRAVQPFLQEPETWVAHQLRQVSTQDQRSEEVALKCLQL